MRIQNWLSVSVQGMASTQEDATFVDPDRGIFVVADGFGGPQAGKEAAQVACAAVYEFLKKESGDRDATLPFEIRRTFSLQGNILFNALIHAHRRLQGMNDGRSIQTRGGASLVAGMMRGRRLVVAQLGACGAVLKRDGVIVPLVTPRSYSRILDPLSRDGRLNPCIPLSAAGLSDDDLEPEVTEVQLEPNDVLGFYTPGVSDAEMKAVLQSLQSLQSNDTKPEDIEKIWRDQSLPSNASLVLVRLGS